MKRPILIGVLLCTVPAMLALVALLATSSQLQRVEPSIAIAAQATYDPLFRDAADAERFRKAVTATGDTEAQVLSILAWVMNEVPRVGEGSGRSAWQLLEAGRSSGLTCGGMADIFREALLAQGIAARRVILQRNLFDTHDNHVTVEAWVNGKWRLYDPTFHIALRSNGERVGAFEVRDQPVEIEFLGPVRYPARTDAYYISYRALFQHVYAEKARGAGLWRALPVIGVWLAPHWLYPEGMSGEGFYRALYYTALVILPLINALLLFALLATWRSRKA